MDVLDTIGTVEVTEENEQVIRDATRAALLGAYPQLPDAAVTKCIEAVRPAATWAASTGEADWDKILGARKVIADILGVVQGEKTDRGDVPRVERVERIALGKVRTLTRQEAEEMIRASRHSL